MRTMCLVAISTVLSLSSALAQDLPGHDHSAQPAAEDMPMGAGPSMQSGMAGALGNYGMTRDGSGTSWQPHSVPMEGLHGMLGDWTTMLHGTVTGVYTNGSGPRGDSQVFSQSMLMGMAQHEFAGGQLTVRGMLSLDPFMGKRGYPLLLQTGETADGLTHLVDRQHPHDLFMELAGIYSRPLSESVSVFVYVGYPGEPALGPTTFMHRFSGAANPEAPLGHHWLDATHITFGVTTLGVVIENWKIEGSLFRGREPDEKRWNFDPLALDSASGRVSYNPTDNLSFQTSYGFIRSPEQLDPTHHQHRLTASGTYNLPFENGNWQTTFAWGQNVASHGGSTNAFLIESAANWHRHTVFARAEHNEKDELFEAPDPLAGIVQNVAKFSLGYVYDFSLGEHLSMGIGAIGSLYSIPTALTPAYGSPSSYTLFTRLRLL